MDAETILLKKVFIKVGRNMLCFQDRVFKFIYFYYLFQRISKIIAKRSGETYVHFLGWNATPSIKKWSPIHFFPQNFLTR